MFLFLFYFLSFFLTFVRPDRLQSGFIFPDLSMEDEKTINVTSENIVRIAGWFDTGWLTKGSGRSYDSLLGIACIIGWLTGKILAKPSFYLILYKIIDFPGFYIIKAYKINKPRHMEKNNYCEKWRSVSVLSVNPDTNLVMKKLVFSLY